MRLFALNVKAHDKPLYRRMLPLLPFYGIRLPYPLSDPGCAGGETVRDGVVEMIASNPEAGNEIGGAGGARKVRIAGRGKGKSDGYRVITFYSGKDVPKFGKPTSERVRFDRVFLGKHGEGPAIR